jgi:hypothetical protein
MVRPVVDPPEVSLRVIAALLNSEVVDAEALESQIYDLYMREQTHAAA